MPYTDNKVAVYQSVAMTYEETKYNPNAVKYYQLAIDNWTKSDKLYGDETDSMRAAIGRLSGHS